ELQHAARGVEGPGNHALALELADVAQIDEYNVVAAMPAPRLGKIGRFDLRVGLVQKLLVAAFHPAGLATVIGFIPPFRPRGERIRRCGAVPGTAKRQGPKARYLRPANSSGNNPAR